MPERAASTEALKTRARTACEEIKRVAEVTHRPLPPDTLCEDLHMAVEKAAARSAESMAALQVAVQRFTAALRDEGVKPEETLIALKSVINAKSFPMISSIGFEFNSEQLRQQISTWSIEEYYRQTKH